MLPPFAATFEAHGLAPLRRAAPATLQVNLGRRCNQACHHCHVEAGPQRTETLAPRTADRVLELLAASSSVETVDLTGGAPELCGEFRRLVREARRLGRRVVDRCNLTVLFEPGQEDTAEFLAEHGVAVVASLPCYQRGNVDRQRGRGVFDRSIEGLRRLNELGYGRDPRLELNLVFNPQGEALPPPQAELEARYREELRALFGLEFDALHTITNMPIKRFADFLERRGRLAGYLGLLVNHFNPETAPELMCRTTVSVGWDGALFDCDFNQMLELPLGGAPRSVFELDSLDALAGAPVRTASHCYGCTAGAGSSCTGALSKPGSNARGADSAPLAVTP